MNANTNLAVVGIDIAKNVFQLHWIVQSVRIYREQMPVSVHVSSTRENSLNGDFLEEISSWTCYQSKAYCYELNAAGTTKPQTLIIPSSVIPISYVTRFLTLLIKSV